MIAIHRSQHFVVIVAVHYLPAVRRIASSLEAHRAFGNECWYALRCWRRSRRMGMSEALAESWASVLKQLWNPVHGPLTGVIADRLQLHLAGYRGAPDDNLCRLCQHGLALATLPTAQVVAGLLRAQRGFGYQPRAPSTHPHFVASECRGMHSPAH